MRPCFCDHCHLCRLYHDDPRYRALWDQGNSQCKYLGPPTGEERECDTCKGRVRLKVFQCHHPAHGCTTLSQCRGCADFDFAL
jgi:hypothetical protein